MNALRAVTFGLHLGYACLNRGFRPALWTQKQHLCGCKQCKDLYVVYHFRFFGGTPSTCAQALCKLAECIIVQERDGRMST